MRVYTRYSARASGANPWGGFIWLLVLLGALVMGWLWWHSAKTKPVKAPLRTVAVLTNRVVVSTNVVIRPAPVAVRTNKVDPPMVLPKPATVEGGFTARPVQNVFEAQLALARQGISSGSLDGAIGSQTRAALRAFQQRENLAETGELDAATKAQLLLTAPVLTNYVVTSSDLARLMPLGTTWLEKSQQARLDYETMLELLAEKGGAHPNLIRRLNPALDMSNIVAGVAVQIPFLEPPVARGRAATVKIFLSQKTLEVFDENARLLAHFPCSIAQRMDKRPVGELRVAVVAPNPNYTFNPEVFPESAEARVLGRKLILPPGPNNPVGVAWIGLSLPGYGIHGTPRPEDVGRTESHGCFRLANWNAEFLLRLVLSGTPVLVEL